MPKRPTGTQSLVLGGIILILLLIVIGPLLTIWALNTLFGLSIAYSTKTWFACLLLAGIVNGSANKGKSK